MASHKRRLIKTNDQNGSTSSSGGKQQRPAVTATSIKFAHIIILCAQRAAREKARKKKWYVNWYKIRLWIDAFPLIHPAAGSKIKFMHSMLAASGMAPIFFFASAVIVKFYLMVMQKRASSGICHSLSMIFDTTHTHKIAKMCLTHFRIDYQLQTYKPRHSSGSSGEANKWFPPSFVVWVGTCTYTLVHNAIFDGDGGGVV